MKKLIVIPLLLLFAVSGYAQLFKIFGHEVGFFYAGPKVGVNFSKFSKWSYADWEVKNRFGYQAGIVGEIGLTSRFSFQTELNFVSKGTKGILNEVEVTKKMNTLAIPLLAKYSFSFLGLKKVYAIGGTYSTISSGDGKEVYDDGTVYNDYHWTKMDWGLSFGCGAEYPTEKGIWGLDLRYDLGLVDVYRQMDESEKSQFRSFSVSLTYKFDLVDLFFKMKNKNKTEETTQ